MQIIEIVYFEGCPNYAPAVALAREVVRDLGLDTQIRIVEVTGPEDAARLHFLGSPSFRVNGVDIEPNARSRTDFGFACRTYDGEGLPPRGMLVAALEGGSYDTIAGRESTGGTTKDCCAAQDSGEVKTDTQGQTKRSTLWTGGALAAAVVASACCWLPLLLIGLGVSAAGAGALFETTRPIFLGLAAVLLASGFYYTYFRKEKCAPGSACATPNPKLKRGNRIVLWIGVVGVLVFASFPLYVSAFLPGPIDAVPSDNLAPATLVTLKVDGMSCEGCAVTLHNELVKVAGVLDATVEFDEGRALVSVSAATPPSTESLIAAVEKAGYTASLTGPQ